MIGKVFWSGAVAAIEERDPGGSGACPVGSRAARADEVETPVVHGRRGRVRLLARTPARGGLHVPAARSSTGQAPCGRGVDHRKGGRCPGRPGRRSSSTTFDGPRSSPLPRAQATTWRRSVLTWPMRCSPPQATLVASSLDGRSGDLPKRSRPARRGRATVGPTSWARSVAPCSRIVRVSRGGGNSACGTGAVRRSWRAARSGGAGGAIELRPQGERA